MADVTIICVKCGESVRVSEFVDPIGMRCAKCGEPLPPPVKTKRGPAPSVVRKLREATGPEIRDTTEPEKAQSETIKRAKSKPRREQTTLMRRIVAWRPSNYVGSWFMFITLGTGLAWIRWGAVLTPSALDDAILYGKIIFTLLCLVIVVEAFREETFEGMLCFFIPGYAFFYLFTKSDSFYLRSLIGAFGVSFGYDAFLVLIAWASDVIEMGSNWISSGGGNVR